MALTELQNKINLFTKEHNLTSSIEIRMLDLASEIGELSKEVLKGNNYGTEMFETTQNWEYELGDVLFSLICLANNSNTDLEQCLNKVLEKYEKRFAKTGDLGSER